MRLRYFVANVLQFQIHKVIIVIILYLLYFKIY